jgi:hypothetical protein
MNKHFEDTRYYLKRAGEHAKAGVEEELEPIQERLRGIIGDEEEPEPSRVEQLQSDLRDLEAKAEGEARERIEQAKAKVREYRGEPAEEAA